MTHFAVPCTFTCIGPTRVTSLQLHVKDSRGMRTHQWQFITYSGNSVSYLYKCEQSASLKVCSSAFPKVYITLLPGKVV